VRLTQTTVWLYYFHRRRCANIWRVGGFEYLVSDDADVVIEALKAAGILARRVFPNQRTRGKHEIIVQTWVAARSRPSGGQPMIAPIKAW
jgi:hypothetical protein